MKLTELTPEEVEHINSITVPILSGQTMWLIPGDGDEKPHLIAVYVLDVSQRPDVADLERVTRFEGLPREKNPPVIYFSDPEPGILHHFKFNEPVKCEYALFLSYEKYPELFPVMIASRRYYTTTGLAKDVVKEGLGSTINGPELEKVIREYWS